MTIGSRPVRTLALLLALALQGGSFARAQVSSAEVTDPRLREPQQTYSAQLLALNRAIRQTKFPYTFLLSRYIGLDPKDQLGADTRGLEFVLFRNRVILKISGNYNAAFNSALLSGNERANRVFDEVVIPILQLIPKYFSPQANFEGFGFEISYHVREQNRSYAYEGKSILTLVLDKADAFSYLNSQRESERQEILDRSEVYLNGKEFGLALGSRDPFDVEALDRSAWAQSAGSEVKEPAASAMTERVPASDDLVRLPKPDFNPLQGLRTLKHVEALSHSTASEATPSDRRDTAGQAQADALQTKYHSQLEALATEGTERYHLVDYAPPSFVTFQNRVYLQVTLRNPAPFDRNATSIYKRAAQSFDLFLAAVLKTLLDKVPGSEEIAGLDITVINNFSGAPAPSSEAVEFVCPLRLLRQFADAEITNQDLINQSAVLVNGIRIALSLQQVE